MAEPIESIVGDPAKVRDLLKEFREVYRQYIDDTSARLDKAIELNKMVFAFHERLLLINIGTIGLSVTAVTSLTSKYSISSLPGGHTFLWLLGTAWMVLLVSTFLCRAVMTGTLQANKSIFAYWSSLSSSFNSQLIMLSLRKLSGALQGKITIESVQHDVSEFFDKSAAAIEEIVSKDTKERLDKIVSSGSGAGEGVVKNYSAVAIFSMQLGLVLLCVAAIKFFLASPTAQAIPTPLHLL